VKAAAGVEIGRDPQPLGKVVFDADQIDDAEAGIGLKIDEEVDVAPGTGLPRAPPSRTRRARRRPWAQRVLLGLNQAADVVEGHGRNVREQRPTKKRGLGDRAP
jgi:hypothetical protein